MALDSILSPGNRRHVFAPAAAVLCLVVLMLAVAGATPRGRVADPAFPAQNSAAPPLKPLTPEMTLNRWSIGDLRLSPDGNRVAMVVSEPAKPAGQRRNIWVYDSPSRALKQFTASTKSDTRPRWSPDGRMLAFLSNREGTSQVYLISPDGGEARPLTESKTGITSFDWAPDGKRIAFETTAPKTEEEEKKEKDKDDANIIGKPEGRTLFQVIDVESKTIKTLIQGAWRISEYVWTPDGDSLMMTATDNPQEELFSEKIYRVSAADGKMTFFAAPAGPFANLKVSPDGKMLAYVGSRGDGPDPHDIIIQPLSGGEARNLTSRSIDRPIGSYVWEDAGNLFSAASVGFGNAFFTVTVDGKAERSDVDAAAPGRLICQGEKRTGFRRRIRDRGPRTLGRVHCRTRRESEPFQQGLGRRQTAQT